VAAFSLYLTMAAVPNSFPGQYRLRPVADIELSYIPAPLQPFITVTGRQHGDLNIVGRVPAADHYCVWQ